MRRILKSMNSIQNHWFQLKVKKMKNQNYCTQKNIKHHCVVFMYVVSWIGELTKQVNNVLIDELITYLIN